MKINTPVSNIEIVMQDGEVIVSKTDLKGQITYVNEVFVRYSGFSREELIGQNHNIVRHPDMPPAAFAWLWDTIKKGETWSGIVKNRCKNGDHYWVEAFVSPIKQNGSIVGYMSVRNKPSRQAIAAADTLYREIREGRAALPKERFRLEDVSFLSKINFIFNVLVALLIASNAYQFMHAHSALDKLVASIACSGIVLTTVGGLWIKKRIRAFVATATRAMEVIAEGNFSSSNSLKGMDEFGRIVGAIEAMRINLRGAVIADVMLASRHLGQASAHLDKEIHESMSRSNAQFDRIVSTNAAIEQIHVAIAGISDLAKRSEELDKHAEEILRRGEQQMQESIASSGRIVEVVNDSRGTILNLKDSIQHISQITGAIRDIAEQTNLLALNAAIEAARAGEQGRGFAVVADEVRKLAERTAISTVEISNTVDGVQQVTAAAVSAMDRTVAEVGKGTALINAVNSSLSEILAASEKGAEMSRQVAEMLSQQSAGVDAVAHNMNEIAPMAESNIASLRSSVQAAEDVDMAATELKQLVAHVR
jgi:aerotaxis receptor